MADYLLQEDGSSKFVLEDSSGDVLLESSPDQLAPPFIASVTAVYAPSVPEVSAPFIASVSTLYAPSISFTGTQTVVSIAGTYTWLCPAGITTVYVECFGGGGGGSDGAAGAGQGGGGGGGGAYAARTAVPVTPGTTYTFVVGAHGVNGIETGVAATDGGDSSFTGDSSSQVIAKGGKGGRFSTNVSGGLASASTGDTGHKFDGGSSGKDSSGNGGGGGASGNIIAAGANGSDGGGSAGGAGGAGANGGGSGGHGGTSSSDAGLTAGQSPGGGGGGGGFTVTGANGADGQVLITTAILMAPIPSVTQVYPPALTTPTVDVPFIASTTTVYAPAIANVIYPPFISSVTVVYTPALPEIFVPFISSNTHVWHIFSTFDPNARYSSPGNGGETTLIRLNANGVTDTATLVGSLTTSSPGFTLTGDTAFPTTRPFVVAIDDEQIYVSPVSPHTYLIRARARGNTTAASHTAGATVSWGDSYDQALTATAQINHDFTANINSTGSFTYPGWLICFDSSQAYLDNGSRYPMHVSELVGVFDAGAGVTGTSRLDGPQPNAISTPTGASDDCPAALSNPARIQTNILIGDVAVLRYTNPEAVVLDLGPRSASLQSWFGLKRVDTSDNDVTFTDPNGIVVDTTGTYDTFTGSVNGEWDPAPLLTGIAPDASNAAGHAVSTPNPVPWTTVTLPGTDRKFTFGSGGGGYDEQGWPMCCLAVRQGDRRVPLWQSWDWHNFSYVFSGFGTDCNYAQILINRNGVLFHTVPAVELPGSQDIDGPDAVWDDASYAFGASWYVVIFATPYIVAGPVIGGTPGPLGGGSSDVIPGVTFIGGTPDVGGNPSQPPPEIEGGSGGNIGGATGLHVWQTS